MEKINVKSDFKLLEKWCSEGQYQDSPFEFRYYVTDKDVPYIASYDGSEYSNCKRQPDGNVLVVFKDTAFTPGRLKATRQYSLTDSDFKEGRFTYIVKEMVDVELTSMHISDSGIPIENQIYPYTVPGDSAYEVAVKNGFEGTEDEWLQSLKGAEIDELKIKEMDDSIAQLWLQIDPLKLTVSCTPSIGENGKTYDVKLSFSGNRELLSAKINGEPATSPKTFFGVTGSSSYKLEATAAGGRAAECSASIVFVDASYYGLVDEPVESFDGLTKVIKNGKSLYWADISSSSLTRLCYIYPKVFGLLSSIKDGNGFDYLADSYDVSEITVNGVAYYRYTLKDKALFTNLTQKFD